MFLYKLLLLSILRLNFKSFRLFQHNFSTFQVRTKSMYSVHQVVVVFLINIWEPWLMPALSLVFTTCNQIRKRDKRLPTDNLWPHYPSRRPYLLFTCPVKYVHLNANSWVLLHLTLCQAGGWTWFMTSCLAVFYDQLFRRVAEL